MSATPQTILVELCAWMHLVVMTHGITLQMFSQPSLLIELVLVECRRSLGLHQLMTQRLMPLAGIGSQLPVMIISSLHTTFEVDTRRQH